MARSPLPTAAAAAAAALILLMVLLCPLHDNTAFVSAAQHIVGGKRRWTPDVNYTEWVKNETFYLHDWLVFFYQKGYYDVVQVNETAFNNCNTEEPILNWSRGHSYAMQLNHTGKYYFTCSGGYCWHGMKLAINVQPLPPPPAEAPAQHSSATAAAAGRDLVSFVMWTFVVVVASAALI